jgi:hypothetical protein
MSWMEIVEAFYTFPYAYERLNDHTLRMSSIFDEEIDITYNPEKNTYIINGYRYNNRKLVRRWTDEDVSSIQEVFDRVPDISSS